MSCEYACPEYVQLSRRQFVGYAGGAVAAAAIPAWLPRVALAHDDCLGRDVIISIFLRGASDGLSMCVPFLESNYYASRPTLAVPPPDSPDPNHAIDLDGQFGLPPALAPLLPAYQAGHLAIVHACGSKDPSRSHFDAQYFMEAGLPGQTSLFSGWLARHLQTTNPMVPGAPLRGVGIATALQRTLVDAPGTLPIPNLDTFGLTGSSSTTAKRMAALVDMYEQVEDPLKAAALTTQATVDLLNTINFSGYVPSGGAVYPNNSFGTALKSTAALIKAEVGVEAIAIDYGGWDTHSNQGVFAGAMYNLMDTLSKNLAAFHTDMFTAGKTNFTLVVMSEFGRRLSENGTIGTDHGHGNVMYVMGGQVKGGKVHTQWPTLEPGKLFEGKDLDVTIDFRDVLAEIVALRLQNQANLGFVFPSYTPAFPGIINPCP